MLCIAAFVIFAILGIFSSYYRSLAKKAWHCVIRKVSFRPCDANLAEEIKGRLLGPIAVNHPRLTRFLDRWSNVFAFIFVMLSLWSLLFVVKSGLNLWVYDTCYPQTGQSCSLAGESCTVGLGGISFAESVKTNQEFAWFKDKANFYVQTIASIPSRFKHWDPKEYVDSDNTYYYPFDESKLTALEIIDPGCRFCAELFRNIKSAGFEDKYNLTYLVYPIKDKSTSSGYRFANSYILASYLEAMKQIKPQATANVSPDWQLLELIFTGLGKDQVKQQDLFNVLYTHEQAEEELALLLAGIGYDQSQIAQIKDLTRSEGVIKQLAENRKIVEEHIRTAKIPTIIFDGRRFDRVIGTDKLK